jgi:hypothetical protein
MGTLQEQITSKFLEKLEESKKVDSTKIEHLRKLLTDHKKPKADHFVKIFTLLADGDDQ